METCSYAGCDSEPTRDGRCFVHQYDPGNVTQLDRRRRAHTEPDLVNPPATAMVHPYLAKPMDRIVYIMHLMSERIWNKESTRPLKKQLAALWDVSFSSVHAYADQAGRFLKMEVREDAHDIGAYSVGRLKQIAESNWDKPGDKAAAVAALNALLKFAGMEMPDDERVQKVMFAGMVDVDASPEKAREIMAGLFNAAKKPGTESGD